jgi:surfeit locus 1 family protein
MRTSIRLSVLTLAVHMIFRLRRPRWFSWVLLAFGLTFFITLGNWQTSRGKEKQSQLAALTDGKNAKPVNLSTAVDRFPMQRYVKTMVSGRFVGDKTLLLDSARMDGQIGVQVYQAFETEGRTVLVGLGFLPIPPDRSSFPEPQTPIGAHELVGLYGAPPSSGIRLSKDTSAPETNTWLVTRIDPQSQQAFFQKRLESGVLMLDPVPNPVADPKQVLALKRAWHLASMPPERHFGYALTWYGFAVTAVVIFLILNRQKQAK